jgi:hypothetical protein
MTEQELQVQNTKDFLSRMNRMVDLAMREISTMRTLAVWPQFRGSNHHNRTPLLQYHYMNPVNRNE